ncbi:unnamed protein product, partial [marine sediment metagenome]
FRVIKEKLGKTRDWCDNHYIPMGACAKMGLFDDGKRGGRRETVFQKASEIRRTLKGISMQKKYKPLFGHTRRERGNTNENNVNQSNNTGNKLVLFDALEDNIMMVITLGGINNVAIYDPKAKAKTSFGDKGKQQTGQKYKGKKGSKKKFSKKKKHQKQKQQQRTRGGAMPTRGDGPYKICNATDQNFRIDIDRSSFLTLNKSSRPKMCVYANAKDFGMPSMNIVSKIPQKILDKIKNEISFCKSSNKNNKINKNNTRNNTKNNKNARNNTKNNKNARNNNTKKNNKNNNKNNTKK